MAPQTVSPGEDGHPKFEAQLLTGALICTFVKRVQSLNREDAWRRKRQPASVFLPGEFHGQRSLAGCSSWGRRVRHDWGDLAKLKSGMIYTTLLQDVAPGKTGERTQEVSVYYFYNRVEIYKARK